MSALLAIDTAAPRLQLALLENDRVDTLIEDMPTGQAERIFPAISELLARNSVIYADLTRIAVTTGPGSFTGLRIGLSAARGLGLALSIPVIGIGSLQAISLSAPSRIPLSVLLDARRNESYFERFLAPGEPVDGPVLLPTATALGRVPQGTVPLTDPFPDIAALARFALDLDPALFPPQPNYVRDADAKPQDRFRAARLSEATP